MVTSAGERVAAHLRDAILAGDIKPGERLIQAEIADRLGASRLPVREALRMLEVDGLTENVTNKGARVPLPGARDLDLLYQMRERLEPLALAVSMANMSQVDIETLAGLQAEIEADCDDIDAFLSLDRRFHLLSYASCDLETLTNTVTRLWNSTHYYRRVFVTMTGPGNRWIINAEHNLLLDAIRRGDPVDAGLCLQTHIRRTRLELLRHPDIFD